MREVILGMERSIQSASSGGRIFGFPLKGFSLFQSLLLAVASAFFTFFACTTISIYALMIWNVGAEHKINFADSYLYVGFPAGVAVLLIALPFFLIVWFRANMRS
jgi:hypothetical protein